MPITVSGLHEVHIIVMIGREIAGSPANSEGL